MKQLPTYEPSVGGLINTSGFSVDSHFFVWLLSRPDHLSIAFSSVHYKNSMLDFMCKKESSFDCDIGIHDIRCFVLQSMCINKPYERCPVQGKTMVVHTEWLCRKQKASQYFNILMFFDGYCRSFPITTGCNRSTALKLIWKYFDFNLSINVQPKSGTLPFFIWTLHIRIPNLQSFFFFFAEQDYDEHKHDIAE